MPYENKRVKDGNHPSRAVAHDSFFTEPDKQAAAPAPFFTKKDTDKEDAPVQGQFIQPKAKAGEPGAKAHNAVPPKANNTGLPDDLKAGMEDLSGFSLDDVNVHYNSDRPAQLKAYAHTQGRDIHVGPGQEKHLAHEAWHTVQQKQGRVNATMQLKGVGINDDEGLEREADVMGKQALQRGALAGSGDEGQHRNVPLSSVGAPVQRLTGFEVETNIPVYHETGDGNELVNPAYMNGFTPAIRNFLFGGLKYGAVYGFEPEGHFTLTADHNELQGPHNKLMHLLSLSGFLKPEVRKRNIANLEYVTPPRDELGTGSNELFREDVGRVKSHVDGTLGLAKGVGGAPVPYTGNWMLTGVPREDILKWVEMHKAHPSPFAAALDEFAALITNKLYVQETTGVLPEDIPKLYSGASKRMKGDKLTPATIMAEFMEAGVKLGLQVYEAVSPDTLPEPFRKYKGAVIGYLTYLASHLLADTLSLTNLLSAGSTEKNLFPYFPKVPLSTSFKALPETLRSETATWKSLLVQLCENSGAYSLKYWESKGLVINRNAMKSKIFQEWSPYYATLPEEDKNIELKPQSANTALNKLVEGKEVTIGVQKNLPGLDKPHDLVIAEKGQQAIPVEDRFWNDKFGGTITTDTIEKAFMSEAAAAIDRQLTHIPGEQQENIAKGINDKPDYKKMQQQREEQKLKDIQEFPGKAKAESGENHDNISIYTSRAEEAEKKFLALTQVVERVESNVTKAEKLSLEKRPFLLELKRLNTEKEGLEAILADEKITSKEEPAAKLKEVETAIVQLKLKYVPTKEKDDIVWQSLKTDLKIDDNVLAKARLGLKKLKEQLQTAEKMVRREKDNLNNAIQDEIAFKAISEKSMTFVPGSTDKMSETDLNQRKLEQKKLENTWRNKLGTGDVLYTFDKAKEALEKDLKIDQSKWKKRYIDVEQLKETPAKETIQKILEDAAALEPVISKYDSLSVKDASPEISALLFEYMKVAEQYNTMIQMAFDAYQKAEKKEEFTEDKH